MKIPFHTLALLFGAALCLPAQINESGARIEGAIPDGTPPPPEVPMPKFVVPQRDILASKTYAQGGRKITIQQVKPISLPAPAIAAPPIDPQDPAVQAALENLRANPRPKEQLLLMGASIFHLPDGSARSFVRLWPNGQGEPIAFWSEQNFALLSGMSSFIGSDNEARSYLLAWSEETLDSAADRRRMRDYDAPGIPDFPAGGLGFVITSGQPSAETLVSLNSIHELLQNDHTRLQAAYEGRKRLQKQQQAELAANPPKPKDLILTTWKMEPVKAPEKGAVR